MKNMRAVYRNRLLRLAKFLRALPPERFAFHQWVGSGWAGKPDLSCGTTACALWWAATLPEFNALGVTIGGTNSWFPFLVDGKEGAWSKVAHRLFGLDRDDAKIIFTPNYEGLPPSASAKMVADGIVKFVKRQRLEGFGRLNEKPF